MRFFSCDNLGCFLAELSRCSIKSIRKYYKSGLNEWILSAYSVSADKIFSVTLPLTRPCSSDAHFHLDDLLIELGYQIKPGNWTEEEATRFKDYFAEQTKTMMTEQYRGRQFGYDWDSVALDAEWEAMHREAKSPAMSESKLQDFEDGMRQAVVEELRDIEDAKLVADTPSTDSGQLEEEFSVAVAAAVTPSRRLNWLSNTFDPSHPAARAMVAVNHGQSREEAWASHLKWLKGKVIGAPQPTKECSLASLKKMNMVGVYEPLPVSCGVEKGSMRSGQPNMQNIPMSASRGPLAPAFRHHQWGPLAEVDLSDVPELNGPASRMSYGDSGWTEQEMDAAVINEISEGTVKRSAGDVDRDSWGQRDAEFIAARNDKLIDSTPADPDTPSRQVVSKLDEQLAIIAMMEDNPVEHDLSLLAKKHAHRVVDAGCMRTLLGGGNANAIECTVVPGKEATHETAGPETALPETT